MDEELALGEEKQEEDMEDLEDSNERKFSSIIDIKERELNSLVSHNRTVLHQLFSSVRRRFDEALVKDYNDIDRYPYSCNELFDYSDEFLAQLDHRQVQDIFENMQWYQENSNEILLNIGYPSRQEKEFLKHIEKEQLKKNDLEYRKI